MFVTQASGLRRYCFHIKILNLKLGLVAVEALKLHTLIREQPEEMLQLMQAES